MTWDLPPSVADTNVIISALCFPQSTAAKALTALSSQRLLICSANTLAELEAVWLRPKFERYAGEAVRRELLFDFTTNLRVVSIRKSIRACRDPRDDKFLELAVSGGADLILTGDADLLALHPFRGIAVLSPAAYLASIGAEG